MLKNLIQLLISAKIQFFSHLPKDFKKLSYFTGSFRITILTFALNNTFETSGATGKLSLSYWHQKSSM